MVDRAKKISELPAATTVANTDFVIVVANTSGTANTKRITANNFRNSLLTSFTSNTVTITTLTASNTTANNLVATTISTDDITCTGNVYLGVVDSNAAQLVHIGGTIHSNVVPHTPNNYQLGNTTHYFSSIDVRTVKFADGTSQNTTFKWSSVPANSTASGTVGQVAYDSDYVYVCVATNTWKRLSLGTY
jgi:hypothetical protein